MRSATIILDRMIFQGCQVIDTNDNRGGAVFGATHLIVLGSEFLNIVVANSAGATTSLHSGAAVDSFGSLSVSNSRQPGDGRGLLRLENGNFDGRSVCDVGACETQPVLVRQ